jgi:hypothetical protein
MIPRLYRLCFSDSPALRRERMWCFMVVFSYAIFNDIILDRPQVRVGWESAVLGCVCMLTSSLLYRGFVSVRNRGKVSLSRRMLLLKYAISSTLMVLFGEIPFSKIEAAVVSERLERLSREPLDSQRLSELTDFVLEARKTHLEADKTQLASVGKKIFEANGAESVSPEVLKALAALGGYKSSLNVSEWPVFDKPYVPAFKYEFSATRQTRGALVAWGHVPISDAARFEPLGSNINRDRPEGPAFLEVEPEMPVGQHADFTIDGMWIKNALIKKSHIAYFGDKTYLDNVYFQDCWFTGDQNPEGLRFLSTLVTSPGPVTFVSGLGPFRQ